MCVLSASVANEIEKHSAEILSGVVLSWWFGLVQGKLTPLHWATNNGHSESVQLLLTAKGNIHAESTVSDSVLQI